MWGLYEAIRNNRESSKKASDSTIAAVLACHPNTAKAGLLAGTQINEEITRPGAQRNDMKIKVGGRYVARNGEVVTISNEIKSTYYQTYHTKNGMCFTKDGFYCGPAGESDHDLLHEFKDHGAQSNTSPLWWPLGIAMLIGLTWLSFNFEKIVLLIEKFQ